MIRSSVGCPQLSFGNCNNSCWPPSPAPFDWNVGIGIGLGREWQCKMYRGRCVGVCREEGEGYSGLKLGQFALRCESNVVERMKGSVTDTLVTLAQVYIYNP